MGEAVIIVEMELIEKKKDSITVTLSEMDETLLYPLIHQLMNDSDVADVQYKLGHPQFDKPEIYVKVKSGKPQTALKRAAKAISGEYTKYKELVEAEL